MQVGKSRLLPPISLGLRKVGRLLAQEKLGKNPGESELSPGHFALFDVPAALYQSGVLNLYIVEAMIAIYATIFFVIVYKVLYKNNGQSKS